MLSRWYPGFRSLARCVTLMISNVSRFLGEGNLVSRNVFNQVNESTFLSWSTDKLTLIKSCATPPWFDRDYQYLDKTCKFADQYRRWAFVFFTKLEWIPTVEYVTLRDNPVIQRARASAPIVEPDSRSIIGWGSIVAGSIALLRQASILVLCLWEPCPFLDCLRIFDTRFYLAWHLLSAMLLFAKP